MNCFKDKKKKICASRRQCNARKGIARTDEKQIWFAHDIYIYIIRICMNAYELGWIKKKTSTMTLRVLYIFDIFYSAFSISSL